MKKRTWLITLVLLLVLFLGIGVKKQMDKEAQKQEVHQAEELIAQDVNQKYEGIEKIRFNDVEHNATTGSYDLFFNINNGKTDFFYTYFRKDDFFEMGPDGNYVEQYFKKKKSTDKNSSSNDLKIIYIEDTKEH